MAIMLKRKLITAFYCFYAIFGVICDTKSQMRLFNETDIEIVPRVVRGIRASLGDIPYQVGFRKRYHRMNMGSTFCGGSIIAPSVILSAAHCFAVERTGCAKLLNPRPYKKNIAILYAVAGNLRTRSRYSSKDSTQNGQWRGLKNVTYPALYKFPYHDIAIVFTLEPFQFNEYVGPITYARRYKDYRGKCLVSGYGLISRTIQSDTLLKAQLKLLPNRRCSRLHRRNMENFVCTVSSLSESDVGKGDSGGPLVCFGTKDPNEVSESGVLVGIVSGHRYRAGSFFTRVSSYYEFIRRNRADVNRVVIFALYLNSLINMSLYLFRMFYFQHLNGVKIYKKVNNTVNSRYGRKTTKMVLSKMSYSEFMA